MASSQRRLNLEGVFRQWAEGSLGLGEFRGKVFKNLTPENFGTLLMLASPEDLEALKAEAIDAPTTEEGWSSTFVTRSWCGPWNEEIAERLRQEDADSLILYRRGIETFRACIRRSST